MKRPGFTLIELLITIAIIAIVSSVIFVLVDPVQRFKDSRNSKRKQDIESLINAIRLYQVDNKGLLPSGIDNNWRMLGTASNGCDVSCSNSISSSTSDNILQEGPFAFISGIYTSSVLSNSNSTTNWTNLSWLTNSPYGKELPNNGGVESGYPTGNLNMSGNVGLYHLNEASGATTFVDSSGNNNNGFCVPPKCPTMGVTGKLNTAGTFGINNYISIPKTASNKFNSNSAFSLSAWIYSTAENSYVIIQDAPEASPYRGIWFMYGSNAPDGKRKIHLTILTIGGAIGVQTTNQLTNNQWHHVVATYNGSRTSGGMKLYVDGSLAPMTVTASAAASADSSNSNPWRIGADSAASPVDWFYGKIDEVSMFNKVLSATEISNMYLRGAARLKLQIRSCDDSSCVGESFVGPDNTNSTYYTEGTNLTPPSFSLSNNTNLFFQYKAIFESDSSGITPNLQNVSISYNQSENSTIGDTLQSACLDLSNDLSSQFTKFPFDPTLGTPERSYYAIKKEDNNLISAWSCGAEDEVIKISK